MKSRKIRLTDTRDIYVPPGRRELDLAKVDEIAASMDAIGLLNPIVVRYVNKRVTLSDGDSFDRTYHLVIGRHRLAAAIKLGWEDIECEVVEADDRCARMLEIAENLHRADLTKLERDLQTAEWIELAKEEEKAKAQLAPSGHTGGRPSQGINAAVRELGIDRTEAQRAMKIAATAPEAQEEARKLKLDNNQSALLEAAKHKGDREKQVETLRARAARRDEARSLQQPSKTGSSRKVIIERPNPVVDIWEFVLKEFRRQVPPDEKNLRDLVTLTYSELYQNAFATALAKVNANPKPVTPPPQKPVTPNQITRPDNNLTLWRFVLSFAPADRISRLKELIVSTYSEVTQKAFARALSELQDEPETGSQEIRVA